MWKWENGRGNEYYSKKLLFRIPKFMDCWLIKYAKGAGIGWHVDRVPGKKHYRLNIALINGGEFWIKDGKPGIRHVKGRVIFFRPDTHSHSVKVVGENQRRLVLSFGWII